MAATPPSAAGRAPAPAPYQLRPSLLTRGELALYPTLRRVVPDKFVICMKVRMVDLIDVRKGTPDWQSWWNRVAQKHIDFVICDRNTLRPLLGIELDDKSHDREDRQERDELLDDALASAGLRLFRVQAQRAYDVRELEEEIRKRLPLDLY